MPRQKILAALVVAGLAAAALLGVAGTAGAAQSAVSDCNAHSRLTAHYSPTQLRSALATMPADIKEYTNCYDVIQRALLTEVGELHGASGAASGSGGSLLPTPVLVALIVLVVAAAGVGMLALRRRGGAGGADQLG